MLLEVEEFCAWIDEYSEGTCVTGCGASFVSPDGTPSDFGMKYCPYCGKKISMVEIVEQEQAEQNHANH